MLSLKIGRDVLLKAVAQASSIAEKRSSMPILSNILLEALGQELKITATDLEITFQGAYPAEIERPGKLTIPARKLLEIVRLLDAETVELAEVDNFTLELTAGHFNTKMYGLQPDDFPPMPAIDDLDYLEIPSKILIDAIDKTIFSVAIEETRYNLAGVYWEKIEEDGQHSLILVSTDGHRLNMVELKEPLFETLKFQKGVIISKKGLTELKKMAESQETILLALANNNAVAKSEKSILVMRLLEGRFPDYNLVIPKDNSNELMVSRRELWDVLRRISTMSSDDYKAVKFHLQEDLLIISSVNPELGKAEESLKVVYSGPEIEVGFNPRYFMEVFGALESENISISFNDGSSPCLIKAVDDPCYLGVVMPMKL